MDSDAPPRKTVEAKPEDGPDRAPYAALCSTTGRLHRYVQTIGGKTVCGDCGAPKP